MRALGGRELIKGGKVLVNVSKSVGFILLEVKVSPSGAVLKLPLLLVMVAVRYDSVSSVSDCLAVVFSVVGFTTAAAADRVS